MKKLFLCAIVAMMMVSIVACGESENGESESQEIVGNQSLNKKSKDELMDESEEETSDSESEDSKKVVSTDSNVAVSEYGDKVIVEESIYAGTSKMSKYDVTIEYANYMTVDIFFEGPIGLSTEVVWEDGTILMMCGGKQLTLFGGDYLRILEDPTLETDAELAEIIENLKKNMQERFVSFTDDELIKLFNMQEASSWVEEREKYLLLMDEAPFMPEAKLGGYAGYKWIFDNSFYVLCVYGEPIETYNDEITLKIFDTIEWNVVE